MDVDAALTREQGITFVVVVVQDYVIASPSTRTATATGLSVRWPGIPIVLMAQDRQGLPTYWGRSDIVEFLASVPVETLPWRHWTPT